MTMLTTSWRISTAPAVGIITEMTNSEPDMGMFSQQGNQLVWSIFQDTAQLKLAEKFTNNDQIWRYAYSRLELLSREQGFREASDTVVREQLWNHLCDTLVIDDWLHVNYWFYVDWMVYLREPVCPQDPFKITVDSYSLT